jgi:hypothetical protein
LDGSQDDTGASGADQVDRRQLLLVGCCLAAVVAAAVLAPTPVDVSTPDRPNASTPAAPPGGGGRVGEGGDPAPIPGETAPPTDGCGVLLEEKPIPGSNVSVGVFESADPVPGVRVRFNGEPVGRTDGTGHVRGPVPYNRTLAVSVDTETDCEFYRVRFDGESDERAGFAPVGAAVPVDERATLRPLTAGRTVATGSSTASAADTATGTSTAARSANNTGEYLVRGKLDVRVVGETYPGSSVRVVADVEGVPVRDGTVTLDESTVGETDRTGGANLTVPDGVQRAWVGVSRGDFEGETDVDVLLLTAALRSREGFAVPGERAAVVARVDEKRADGVTVRRGGRRLGTTGPEGTRAFRLPLSPGGTVVASTSRQTATVPVWHLYVPTALNLFVLFAAGVVAAGSARLFRGRTTAERVAVAWGAVAVADVALIVWEWQGFVFAAVGLAVTGVVYRRRRVKARGEQAAGTAATLAAFSRRSALAVADLLGRVIDRVWRSLERTVTRLTSFEVLAAWLGGLVRKGVATLWVYLTFRRVGIALFALGELTVATVRWGHEGLIASVAGLAVIATIFALLRRDDVAAPVETAGDETEPRSRVERTVESEEAENEERVLSIRALWRRFARWVVPGDWRTKTPGEVARTAERRGLPPEPVEALTEAFREVEYGDEAATTRRERAKAAFDTLARSREDEE